MELKFIQRLYQRFASSKDFFVRTIIHRALSNSCFLLSQEMYAAHTINTKGCLPHLVSTYRNHLLIVGGIALGVGILEVSLKLQNWLHGWASLVKYMYKITYRYICFFLLIVGDITLVVSYLEEHRNVKLQNWLHWLHQNICTNFPISLVCLFLLLVEGIVWAFLRLVKNFKFD